eukprot:m51a1_g1139 putative protein kinase domain containing protein (2304) ;mRNA; f:244672-254196
MNSLLERLERGEQQYVAAPEDDDECTPGPRIRESELDGFLRDVYTFYRRKGLFNIVLTKILNLLALVFLAGVVVCALHFVNYPYLLGWDDASGGGSVFIVDFHRVHPATWVALAVLGVVVLFYGVAAVSEVHAHSRVARFYDVWLHIRGDDLEYIDWPTVVERITRVSNLIESTGDGGQLTALDVMKRITRRENYMVAMVARGVLHADIKLPFVAAPMPLYSQTLEWALGFTLWTINYTTSGFKTPAIPTSEGEEARRRAEWERLLRRRFLGVGIAMGLLSPLIFVLLAAYIAFKYGEELRSRPAEIAGARTWTPYARWRLRELNEAEHLFEERLARATPGAREYAVGFPPAAPVVALAKFLSLVLGAVLLLLVALSLISERFVFTVWGLSSVFYITGLTALLALCRALIPESNAVYDAEASLSSMARHTHYYPRHWRGAARSSRVLGEVTELFTLRPLIWLRELACLFLVPIACVRGLRDSSGDIVHFLADSTDTEPRVGRSCAYASFFDKRFSNSRCGASVHAPRHSRLPNGLMEKSFLSFHNWYVFWEVPEEGRCILQRLAQFAEERDRIRKERPTEIVIPLSSTLLSQPVSESQQPQQQYPWERSDIMMEFYEAQRMHQSQADPTAAAAAAAVVDEIVNAMHAAAEGDEVEMRIGRICGGGRTHFEPGMTAEQFAALGRWLRRESWQPREWWSRGYSHDNAPPREWALRPPVTTDETVFLYPSSSPLGGNMRIACETSSLKIVSADIKVKRSQPHDLPTQFFFDVRISLSAEHSMDPPAELPPGHQSQRRKVRQSYRRGNWYVIDLTEVETGDGGKTYEVELEVLADALRRLRSGSADAAQELQWVASDMWAFVCTIHPKLYEGHWMGDVVSRPVAQPEEMRALRHCVNIFNSDKFPGAMPVNLRRRSLEALRAGEYWVSEKTDGIRQMVLVYQGCVYLVDRSSRAVEFKRANNSLLATVLGERGPTLLDCELVRNLKTLQPCLFVFDALMLRGEAVHALPLSQRLAAVERAMAEYRAALRYLQVSEEFFSFAVAEKKFFHTRDVGQLRQLMRIDDGESKTIEDPARGKCCNIDGLILAPDIAYKPYTNDTMFKWKFNTMWTVDLALVADEATGAERYYAKGRQGPQEIPGVALGPEDSEKMHGDIERQRIIRPDSWRPVVELAYLKGGAWAYHGLRPDKEHPNFIDTVTDTIAVVDEDISLEELLQPLSLALAAVTLVAALPRPPIAVRLLHPLAADAVVNGTVAAAFSGVPTVSLSPAETANFTWHGGAGLRYSAVFDLSVRSSPGQVTGQPATFAVTGLQPHGALPAEDSPGAWSVSVRCSETFVGAFRVVLFVSSADSPTLYETVVIEWLWSCYKPGCSTECSQHGRCDVLMGKCECDAPYYGTDCNVVLASPSLVGEDVVLCPYSQFHYFMEFPSWASPDSWYSLQGDGASEFDWRYFSSDTRSVSPEGAVALPLRVNRSLTLALRPATYSMVVYGTSGYTVLAVVPIVVLPWGHPSCPAAGNASCSSDALCGNRSTGECNNTTHLCDCFAGRFGTDCSRGCGALEDGAPVDTVLAQQRGTVRSDDGATRRNESLYPVNANCQWTIDPDGEVCDTIRIRFQWLDLSDGDLLAFTSPDGTKLLTLRGGGHAAASDTEFHTDDIHVSFTSDYANVGLGFSFEYECVRLPLSRAVQAAIGVPLALGVSLGAALAAAAGLWYNRRRRRREQEELLRPAKEWSPEDEKAEGLLAGETTDPAGLQDSGVYLNKAKLEFDMGPAEPCPIAKELQDNLLLQNVSPHTVQYEAFVPYGGNEFQISLIPGKGVVKAGRGIVLSVSFMLLYTTRINRRVKIAVRFPGSRTSCLYANLTLEGALSDRLDPSEIVLEPAPLGSGSFGAVYRGMYRGRLAAVKILKKQNFMSERQREEFDKEIDLYTKLRNPFIVDFIGASHIPGRLCLCTELFELGNLENFIMHNDVPYPLQLKFACDIAEAMHFLHSHSVLYRDLKPSNVLIASTSIEAVVNCKVGDFGTAKNVECASQVFQYTNGQGTPADLYSFAVTLWQMQTKQLPWETCLCWEIPKRVSSGERPPLPPKCPADFAALIATCWAADPAARPEFEQVITTLQALFDKACNGGKRSRRNTTWRERISRGFQPSMGVDEAIESQADPSVNASASSTRKSRSALDDDECPPELAVVENPGARCPRISGGGLLINLRSVSALQRLTSLEDNRLVVLFFYAEWRVQCKRMMPMFEGLVGKYPRCLFVRVRGDECAETIEAAGVRVLPTFRLYRGSALVAEVVGPDEAALIAAIESNKTA